MASSERHAKSGPQAVPRELQVPDGSSLVPWYVTSVSPWVLLVLEWGSAVSPCVFSVLTRGSSVPP